MVARDRAVRRVSRLTVATAIAGTAAAVGFAGLAAVTYAGTTPTATTQTNQVQSDQLANGVAAPAPATVNSRNRIQTVQPPGYSSGRARVSSGGSG